jgi:hypothetical protein
MGERETGKMLDCIITRDDGTQVDLGPYPEKEKVFETVWQVDWQPEHMPVGSVIRYHLDHRKDGIQEAVVTGHHQNGVKSWVVKTDDQCSILGGEHKTSFNASYVVEVVSRGNGDIRFVNNKANTHFLKMEYLSQQKEVPTKAKRPGLYAAMYPQSVIAFVLGNHPAFHDIDHDGHIYATIDELGGKLRHLFNMTRVSPYSGYCTVNKKRLIKELKVLLSRSRQSKNMHHKEEQRLQREDYERDMKHFFEDAL